jgi:hypothetical protein
MDQTWNCEVRTMSASLEVITLFGFDQRKLGVVLALLSRPSVVQPLLDELRESGQLGEDVLRVFDKTNAALDKILKSQQ